MKSLFTTLPDWEMQDQQKFRTYYKENENDSATVTNIMKVGKACWRLLASHDDVANRAWQSDMLDQDLMKALDDKFTEILSPEVEFLCLSDNPSSQSLLKDYQGEVTDVFDKNIAESTYSDSVQQDVRDELTQKVLWIFIWHKFHYAAPLPLMTKSTILAIRDMFKRNESAIREVSEFC